MGRDNLKHPVPPLYAKLRSMAIDLTNTQLVERCGTQDSWELVVVTDPDKDEVTCTARFPGNASVSLEVRTLNYLLNQLATT